MVLNNLTKEETRVIENKGTEAPYSGKYNDLVKMEFLHVSVVILHYITQKVSLVQAVDGQVLMTR